MIDGARAIAVSLAAALALMGCDKPESPAETRSDMTEAAQEGAEDVAEAREDAMEARGDNLENIAEAQEDVALAKAKADYKVAVEGCEAQTGDARDLCKDAAQNTLDAAQTAADQRRTALENQAEQIKP